MAQLISLSRARLCCGDKLMEMNSAVGNTDDQSIDALMNRTQHVNAESELEAQREAGGAKMTRPGRIHTRFVDGRVMAQLPVAHAQRNRSPQHHLRPTTADLARLKCAHHEPVHLVAVH